MFYGLNEYNQLKFLEQYNFKVENHSNGRYTEICLVNDDVCIVYHEWSQFGDCIVFVSNNLQGYQNHKFLRTYNLNPKKRYSFLELVKFYLENQLENNNTIFEVKI